MPGGELAEYLEQLSPMVEIISAGTVKLEPEEDDDYDDE